MKKLIGILTALIVVACGNGLPSSPTTSDAGTPPAPPPPAVVDASVDASTYVADASAEAHDDCVAVDASTDDADASDAGTTDEQPTFSPPPELQHPECECRQFLGECTQNNPDLFMDCGAAASCVDTPYYIVAPGASWVEHRLISGTDQRAGCVVQGDALCCSH
jgi:hypothetical protein